MEMTQGYKHMGPVDCYKPINVESLKGKTAIVTGGVHFIESFSQEQSIR